MPAFLARLPFDIFNRTESDQLHNPLSNHLSLSLSLLFSRQINLSNVSGIAGAPVRQIPAQHGRLHPRQGVQPEELEDDTQARPTDQRYPPLRQNAEEGEADGAPNKKQTG